MATPLGGAGAAAVEWQPPKIKSLELFHDCGCPVERDCICRIFLEGCGKCSECLKNRLYFRETGVKGTRVCKLATPNDWFTLGKFKIEYPRDLLSLTKPQEAWTHTPRQLYFQRRVAANSLAALDRELANHEKTLADRSRLLMKSEDELELVFASNTSDTAFIDTDLIHGSRQRIRKDQLLPLVLPLIRECHRAIRRIEAIRKAIKTQLKLHAAFHMVRVARGFLGRATARRKRRAILRHFAALRIQSAYRGYYDRKYVIPGLRDALRNRMATKIQTNWRGFISRRTFRTRMRARLWRVKNKKAAQIQATWKGHNVRRKLLYIRAAAADEKAQFELERRTRLANARARREYIKQAAVITIQRVWRGVLGRREAYMRRKAGVVHNGRVRELADRFLTSGDIWGFLAAVNEDYERVEHERNREVTRAKAFVEQVIRVRQTNTEKAYEAWEEFKGGKLRVADVKPASTFAKSVIASETVYGGAGSGRRPGSAGGGKTAELPPGICPVIHPGKGAPPVDEFALKLELLKQMYLKNIPDVDEQGRTVRRGGKASGGSGGGVIPPGVVPSPLHPVTVPSVYDSLPSRAAQKAATAAVMRGGDPHAGSSTTTTTYGYGAPPRQVDVTVSTGSTDSVLDRALGRKPLPSTVSPFVAYSQEPSGEPRGRAAGGAGYSSTVNFSSPLAASGSGNNNSSYGLNSSSYGVSSSHKRRGPKPTMPGALPAVDIGAHRHQYFRQGVLDNTMALEDIVAPTDATMPAEIVAEVDRVSGAAARAAMTADIEASRAEAKRKAEEEAAERLRQATTMPPSGAMLFNPPPPSPIEQGRKPQAGVGSGRHHSPSVRARVPPALANNLGVDLLDASMTLHNPLDAAHNPVDALIPRDVMAEVEGKLAERQEEAGMRTNMRFLSKEMERLKTDPLGESLNPRTMGLLPPAHGSGSRTEEGELDGDSVTEATGSQQPQQQPQHMQQYTQQYTQQQVHRGQNHSPINLPATRPPPPAGPPPASAYSYASSRAAATAAAAASPHSPGYAPAPSFTVPPTNSVAAPRSINSLGAATTRSSSSVVIGVASPGAGGGGGHSTTAAVAMASPRSAALAASKHKATAPPKRIIITAAEVRASLPADMPALLVAVNKRTTNAEILRGNKIGYGKWSKPGQAGVRNLLRRKSAGGGGDESFATIDNVALAPPLTRYASRGGVSRGDSAGGRGMTASSAGGPGVRRHSLSDMRPSTAPVGHANMSTLIAMKHARPADKEDDAAAVKATAAHEAAAEEEDAVRPPNSAPANMTRRAAIIAKAGGAGGLGAGLSGGLDGAASGKKRKPDGSRRGFGAMTVLSTEDASAAAVEIKEERKAPKEGFDEFGRRIVGPVATEEQRQAIAAKLTAAESGGMLDLSAPFDDGWRSTEERRDAEDAKARVLQFSKPYEAETAHHIAESFTHALITTVAAHIEHLAVSKRMSQREREAAGIAAARSMGEPRVLPRSGADLGKGVLYGGAAMLSGFARSMELGKSAVMLEDVYRMTGVRDEPAEAATTAVLSASMGSPVAMVGHTGSISSLSGVPLSVPLSRMEALQAKVDPALRKGTVRRLAPGTSTGGGGGGGSPSGAAAAMATPGGTGAAAGWTDEQQEYDYSASTYSPHAANGGLDVTNGEAVVMLPYETPVVEEEDAPLFAPGRIDTHYPDGFPAHGSGVGAPQESPSMALLSSPSGQILTAASAPLGYSKDYLDLAPLKAAQNVFQQEAMLQSHGLGTPGVRSLLVDVRGLDGPFDMLIYHAVLRAMPVPPVAVEEAKEQGLLTPDEYRQLKKVAGMVNEMEEDPSGGGGGGEGGGEAEAEESTVTFAAGTATTTHGRRGSVSSKSGGKPSNKKLWSQLESHDKSGRRIRRTDEDALSRAAAVMDAEGAGELAARVLRDMAPSIARVVWERQLHEQAYPIVALIKAKQVRFIRDLLTVDMKLLGVNPGIVSITNRLLGVLVAALKLSTPSVVKALYQAKPKPGTLTGSAGAGAAALSPLPHTKALSTTVPPTGTYDIRNSPGPIRGGAAASATKRTAGGSSRTPAGGSISSPTPSFASPSFASPSTLHSGGGGGAAAEGSGRKRNAELFRSGGEVKSMQSVTGRTVRSEARAALGFDRGEYGAASLTPADRATPAGDIGLGSPKGLASVLTPPQPSKGVVWQPSLLHETPSHGGGSIYGSSASAGGGGGSGRGSPIGVPPPGPGDMGSSGFGGPRIMSSSVATRPGPLLEHQPPPPSVIYEHPHLFLPYSEQVTLLSYQAGGNLIDVPTHLELPSDFSVLTRDGAMSATHLATRLVEREEKEEAESASEAIMGLERLRVIGRKKKYFTAHNEEELGGQNDTTTTFSGKVLDADGKEIKKRKSPLEQEKEYLQEMLSAARNPFRPSRDVRVASLAATLNDRLGIVLRVMSENLNGISVIKALDEPIDVAVIQAAFMLPLPQVKLAEMSDMRTRRDRSDRDRATVLAPYDLFLNQLAIVPPILDVLVSGLRSWIRPPTRSRPASRAGTAQGGARATTPGGGGRGGGNSSTSLEPLSEGEMRTVVEAALDQLTIKSKPKLLIQERARAAQTLARPFITALTKWGFTTMGQLIRVPARDLETALKSAYPIKAPGNASHAERCIYRYAQCIPAYGVALLLESVIEYWIATCPEIRGQVYHRTGLYDGRYQRHPTDAARAGSRVSVKEQYFKEGLARAKAMKVDTEGEGKEFVSELMAVARGRASGSEPVVRQPSGGVPLEGAPGIRQSSQQLAFAAIVAGDAPVPKNWSTASLDRNSYLDPATAVFTAEKIQVARQIVEETAPGHGAHVFPLPPQLESRAGGQRGGGQPVGRSSMGLSDMRSVSSFGSVFDSYSLVSDGAPLHEPWKQQLLMAAQAASMSMPPAAAAGPPQRGVHGGRSYASDASQASGSSRRGKAGREQPYTLGAVVNPHQKDPNYKPMTPYRTLAEAKSGQIRFATDSNLGFAKPKPQPAHNGQHHHGTGGAGGAGGGFTHPQMVMLPSGEVHMPELDAGGHGFAFFPPPAPTLPPAVVEPPQ